MKEKIFSFNKKKIYKKNVYSVSRWSDIIGNIHIAIYQQNVFNMIALFFPPMYTVGSHQNDLNSFLFAYIFHTWKKQRENKCSQFCLCWCPIRTAATVTPAAVLLFCSISTQQTGLKRETAEAWHGLEGKLQVAAQETTANLAAFHTVVWNRLSVEKLTPNTWESTKTNPKQSADLTRWT